MALSVLLYEDNDLLRESIGSMMQLDERYIVAGSFNNVLQAEKQVNEIKPDIVLMDIDMPGRTGIEAVKRIGTLRQAHRSRRVSETGDSAKTLIYFAIHRIFSRH